MDPAVSSLEEGVTGPFPGEWTVAESRRSYPTDQRSGAGHCEYWNTYCNIVLQ